MKTTLRVIAREARRRTVEAMIATAALVVLLAGIATAQVAGSADTYAACTKDGKLDVVHVNITPTCKANEELITWNAVGPEGPEGPAGADGAQGPEGPEGPAGSGLAHAFSVYMTTLPTGSSGSGDMTFSGERFDASNAVDNLGRLTVPETGYYLLGASLQLMATVAGCSGLGCTPDPDRAIGALGFRRTTPGGAVSHTWVDGFRGTGTHWLEGSAVVYAEAGDKLTVWTSRLWEQPPTTTFDFEFVDSYVTHVQDSFVFWGGKLG